MAEQSQIEPEQGFFPQRFTISLTERQKLPDQQQRPLLYQARVLASYPTIFKFPKEMYQRHQSIATCPQDSTALLVNPKQQPSQPCKLQECNHKLVYDKFKKGNKNQQMSLDTSREINLDHLAEYNQKDYALLQQKPVAELLYTEIQQNKQEGVQFSSSFQCGNLQRVYRDSQQPNHYICLVQNDSNSIGYNQFFYFGIRGAAKGVVYRFSIVNLTKSQSFFKVGMRPILFSTRRHLVLANGWYRHGYNISYAKTTFFQQKQQHPYYTLSFSIDFEYDSDFVTLSSAIPYSYSRLIYRLKQLKRLSSERDLLFKLQTAAYSLSNNQVPELTITKPSPSQKRQSTVKETACAKKGGKSVKFKQDKNRSDELQSKKVIVILARQHPGQTNSSLLMQEILYQLFEQHNDKARWLLQHFQLRIYPMVNVDGVIYGNSRCDLAGFDLNRTWRHPLKELHPQVDAIIKRLKLIADRIAFCIDLHSHSKMYNVFNYGFQSDDVSCRLLSWLISKNTPFFHFPSCTFAFGSDKRQTLRAIVARLCGPQKVTTIESSYYGVRNGTQVHCFQPKLFAEIGYAVLVALRSYLRKDMHSKRCLKQLRERQQVVPESQKQELEVSSSDSQAQNDVKSLDAKLKGMMKNQKLIEKLKKRYEHEERLLQEQQMRLRQKELQKQQDQQSIAQIQIEPSPLQFQLKEQYIAVSPANRQKPLQEKPKFIQRVVQNRQSIVAKYNIDSQCPELPSLSQQRNAWNRPNKYRRPSKLEVHVRQQSQQQKLSASPALGSFDEKEFQQQMKFLYRQLRKGLRQDYLQRQRLKDKQRLQKNQRRLQKNQLAKSKRIQSLNSLSLAPRNSQTKNKVVSIKGLLPDPQKPDDQVLLRIKSEHCDNMSGRDESVRWRYNLNSSELISKKSEKCFCDQKFSLRNKPLSCLPIFSKFFKLKQPPHKA